MIAHLDNELRFDIKLFSEVNQMTVSVLDPTNNDEIRVDQKMAKRLDSLDKKTIGVIDNGKLNSDVVLNAVSGSIKEKFGLEEIIYFRKPSSSHPIPEKDARELAEKCHGMISGIGD
jgi:hypothetical protein